MKSSSYGVINSHDHHQQSTNNGTTWNRINQHYMAVCGVLSHNKPACPGLRCAISHDFLFRHQKWREISPRLARLVCVLVFHRFKHATSLGEEENISKKKLFRFIIFHRRQFRCERKMKETCCWWKPDRLYTSSGFSDFFCRENKIIAGSLCHLRFADFEFSHLASVGLEIRCLTLYGDAISALAHCQLNKLLVCWLSLPNRLLVTSSRHQQLVGDVAVSKSRKSSGI